MPDEQFIDALTPVSDADLSDEESFFAGIKKRRQEKTMAAKMEDTFLRCATGAEDLAFRKELVERDKSKRPRVYAAFDSLSYEQRMALAGFIQDTLRRRLAASMRRQQSKK